MVAHTEIEIAELHQLLENPACPALLVDVRSADEYRQRHLPSAFNLPLEQLPRRLETLPRERPLILYSNRGQRSADACSLLHAAGFRDICHLRGGIEAWCSSGLKVA